MDVDLTIDTERFLYVVGIVLAVATLLFFTRDVVFGLSITVKAALLFLTFVACLVAATALERTPLHGVTLALAVASYLVGLWYLIDRFAVGPSGTVLALAASSALFIAIGRVYDVEAPVLSRRTAGRVLVGVALIAVLLVGADVAGGGVTYDLETEESITVEPPPETADDYVPDAEQRVGTITATNQFVFRRALDPPEITTCVVGDDRPRFRGPHVDLRSPADEYGYPDSIGGGTTVPIRVELNLERDRNQTEPVTYAVERADECPTDADEPTVAVLVDSDEASSRAV